MSQVQVNAEESMQAYGTKRKRLRAPSTTPHPKGKRHDWRLEILRDDNILAEDGWRSEIQPWTYCVCSKYIEWCHIDKHWPEERHKKHITNNQALYTSCTNKKLTTRMSEVYKAYWGVPSPEDNYVPLCILRMVYAEVILGVDVLWASFTPRAKGGKEPRHVIDIPLHKNLRGTPAPITCPTNSSGSNGHIQHAIELQNVQGGPNAPTEDGEVKQFLVQMKDIKEQISGMKNEMKKLRDDMEILKGEVMKEKEEHKNTKDELYRMIAEKNLDTVVDIASYM